MARIPRSEVVQGVLNLFPDPAYLEVGVSKGFTFDVVKARRKVAVDPAFRFDIDAARINNPDSEYHPMTSDHFFGSAIADGDAFDVIYLDGMHTLEQTLRDFINALHFLKKGGVIVIDDVHPTSYVASIRSFADYRKTKEALKIQDKAWMGDVYRLVYFIDSFFQQMMFRTVKDNHGQLVVWERRRRETTARTVEAVARLSYEQMVLTRDAMRFAPFGDILAEIRTGNLSAAPGDPV